MKRRLTGLAAVAVVAAGSAAACTSGTFCMAVGISGPLEMPSITLQTLVERR